MNLQLVVLSKSAGFAWTEMQAFHMWGFVLFQSHIQSTSDRIQFNDLQSLLCATLQVSSCLLCLWLWERGGFGDTSVPPRMQTWSCWWDLTGEIGSCVPADTWEVIQGSEGFGRVRLKKFRAIWIKNAVRGMLKIVFAFRLAVMFATGWTVALVGTEKNSIMALIRSSASCGWCSYLKWH